MTTNADGAGRAPSAPALRLWPLVAGLATACASTAPGPTPPLATPAAVADSEVLGRTAHVAVVRAGAGDTAASIAGRVLNDRAQAWRLATLDGAPLHAGSIVAVPLDADDPGASETARFVPVLCYHRFTSGRSGSLMEVGADSFDAQLRWLRDNGYTVAPLRDVATFVAGRRVLPPRTVAITIDDGYRSALTVAAPILRRYADPATLFVYTDFVGAKDALSWAEVAAIGRDPLISVQSHSKTHRDMVKRLPGEPPAAYAARRRLEVSGPQPVFAQRGSMTPDIFAYPFGSTDPGAAALVEHEGFRAAFTVVRGGNAAWSAPMLLRRDMIYGTDDLATFARRIQAAEHGGVEGPRETER